jgi:pimeloyl-ACP methyl ester carboxylesterase
MRFVDAEWALWDAFGVVPEETWLELAVTGVRVRALALGAGPTIVFVHGASNAASSWISLAALLPDYRCVLVDRPGCGLSPPLPSPLLAVDNLERFADAFLSDIVDALGETSVFVVGTSFGGYFALRGTAASAERVRGLLTLGWSVGAPIARVPLVMRLGASPRLSKATTRLPAPRAMVKPMLRQIGLRAAVASGAFRPVMIDWFHALLRNTDTLFNEVTSLPPMVTTRGMNDAVLIADEVLLRIPRPVWLVWGSDDPFGGEDIARAFAARIPGASLEMVEAGHAPWIDDAPGIAQRVRAYFA